MCACHTCAGSDAEVLLEADSSLGDEFAKKSLLLGDGENVINVNEQILAGTTLLCSYH